MRGKQRLRFSESAGVSLLEFIVALALGSAILAGLSVLLNMTQRFKAKADSQSAVQELEILLAAEITALLHGYDSQPFHIPPVVHDPGTIRHVNGAPNRVHRSEPRLRPAVNSRAISILVPEFDSRLKIRSTQRSTAVIRGCSPDGREVPFSEFRSALAVSQDSVSELRILSASEEPGGCRRLRVRPSASVFFEALSERALPSIKTIIPVRLEYTLYLDREGDLRYLGQAAGENIENQPILSGVTGFSAKRLETPDSRLLGLRLSAELNGKTVSRSGFSRFSKRDFRELVLNDP